MWYFQNCRWSQVTNPLNDLRLSELTAFQILPDNPGFAPHIEGCSKVESWNGWLCQNNNFAHLTFESEDADRMDRSMQPIYATKEGTTINSKLNAYMDNCWDGFYTCQKRLQRYQATMEGGPGTVYTLHYTGSPARKQRFELFGQNQEAGMTIRIFYPSAESRNLVKDGQIIEFNQWDELEKMYGKVQQRFCGENRYIGVKNIFEFYITPGCMIQIQPRDAIQCLVRMEWTFAQFFADGGTTKFVDRLAASLGIHGSEIKIVSVYEGSLIITYDIFNALNDPVQLEATR